MGTNKKRAKLTYEHLGVSYSTASYRLTRLMLFRFAQKLEMDSCFQCGEKIEKVEDLSIEHKVPWLYSEDPIELFFSEENIAFSHMDCNARAGRQLTRGPRPCTAVAARGEVKDPEKARYKREWRKKNKDRILAWEREYREGKRGELRDYSRNYMRQKRLSERENCEVAQLVEQRAHNA